MYDIIIIGAGPSGMTAGIYSGIARKKVLLLEKEAYGGQILKANCIKNYPGLDNVSGIDYAQKLYNQVKELNIDIKFESALEVKNYDKFKEVITNKNSYKTKTIIIASGAKNRKLGLNNEDKLIGKGISYCATCDGMFFKDKEVAITGGGRTAIDDALYLSNICKKVYVIYRQKEFKFDSINLSNLRKKDNVEFIFNTNIIDINGNEKLESIVLKENDIDDTTTLKIDGLFIAIGHIPVSEMFNNLIKTDEKGYIISNEECTTNIEGIFVAGDIREKNVRQLTTACSDGTIAAINACKYIENEKQTDKCI